VVSEFNVLVVVVQQVASDRSVKVVEGCCYRKVISVKSFSQQSVAKAARKADMIPPDLVDSIRPGGFHQSWWRLDNDSTRPGGGLLFCDPVYATLSFVVSAVPPDLVLEAY
jgi:hypothetical protein